MLINSYILTPITTTATVNEITITSKINANQPTNFLFKINCLMVKFIASIKYGTPQSTIYTDAKIAIIDTKIKLEAIFVIPK